VPPSESYGFRNHDALEDHFRNHSDDEAHAFATVEEYGAMAYAFFLAPESDLILECFKRSTNQKIRYHKETQEFLVTNPEGTLIATYYFMNPTPTKWRDNENRFRRKCLE